MKTIMLVSLTNLILFMQIGVSAQVQQNSNAIIKSIEISIREIDRNMRLGKYNQGCLEALKLVEIINDNRSKLNILSQSQPMKYHIKDWDNAVIKLKALSYLNCNNTDY